MATRICHVTSVHSIDDLRVFHNECKSLAKKYEVYLVAPNVENQIVDGVHIVGVPLPKQRFKRMLKLKDLIPVMQSVDASCYHFHDPELIPIGLKMKRFGKKIVFDSHEDVPAQVSQKEWIPGPLRQSVSRLYSKYEAHRLKQYDALVSVTPSIVNRLKIVNSQTYQVTNYPKFVEYPDNRKWGRSLCFAGGISTQWMHDNIINSLNDIDAKYVLAGFPNETYIQYLKTLPSWSKVDFRGTIKYSEVPALLQQSSMGVALNDYVANVGYKMGSLGNTKLFEYMMAGIPVVCTDFILWKDIVEKNHCGICVNPHDVKAISQAITYILNNPDEAKRMGDAGIRAVKEVYNWDSQERILFELYEKLLSK